MSQTSEAAAPAASLPADTLLTRETPPADTPDQGETQAKSREQAKEPAEGQDAKQPEDQGKEQAKDQRPSVPEGPEGYKLMFGEGTRVDEGMLASFRQTAHELGLPQEQTQALASFYEKHVAAIEQRQTADLLRTIDGWEADIKSRPGFEADAALATKTLKAFGSPALNGILQETLLGSHPAMWDFVVKVGKALGEPEFKGKAEAGGQKSAAEVLYPDMK